MFVNIDRYSATKNRTAIAQTFLSSNNALVYLSIGKSYYNFALIELISVAYLISHSFQSYRTSITYFILKALITNIVSSITSGYSYCKFLSATDYLQS